VAIYAIKGSDDFLRRRASDLMGRNLKKKIDKLILLNSNRPTGYTGLRQENGSKTRMNLIFDLGSFEVIRE